MQEWKQALLTLQERDLRLAKIAAQLRAVPVEKAQVEAQRQQADQAVTAARDGVRTAEKAIKALELDAETLKARMRDFQSKSAMIKNNEEYKAALHQIETCKGQVSELEDRELRAMEALEAAKGVLAVAEKDAAAERERAVRQLADLDLRARNCQAEAEKMKAARPALVQAVPPAVFARYERLHTSRGGQNPNYRAFVPVRNGICGGCNMSVTAQERNDAIKGQLVACATCGCLLYAED
ncbi:MAG: hypothetical protein WC789_11940 [Lentisphaeria bacterium]|jgi:hypothetical protein